MYHNFTQQIEDHDEDEEKKAMNERCNSIYASIDKSKQHNNYITS